jgi:DNA polymerase
MNLDEASFAVLEELKLMRKEGIRELYLEKETMQNLEKALGTASISHPRAVVHSSIEQNPDTASPSGSKLTPADPITPPLRVPPEEIKRIMVAGTGQADGNDAKFAVPPSLEIPDGNKTEQWEWLENEVKKCKVSLSELEPTGQIIFGRGDLDADLFFCGEAPSEEDEKAGSAFGGNAGDLLGKMIEAMGFPETSVYVSNILHWKPKHEQSFGHRPPTQAEIQFALPFLRAQLEIVQPKVIISLGKIATDGFLGFDPNRRLGDVRGKWNEYEGIPLMVTYHPSYLLHNPSKAGKRKVWEDMLMIMERVGASISEKQKGYFL